jgi:hypothetical protein
MSRHSRLASRRIAPALLALGLVACSTAGDDSTSETAAPATTAAVTEPPVETDAPVDTEPADTATPTTDPGPPAPLILGFDLSSGDINATREKYGVAGQNSSLLNEDYYVALIDAYNADGGMNGHEIVPLTYTPPTGDVAADVINQERCEAYFAGDTVATAVVGTNDPILNTCATEAGSILFGRGFTGLDQASLESFPGHVNPQAATFDRAAAATVDLAATQDVIGDGDTAGVVYPGCEAQSAVFENTLRPALEALGVTVSAFEGTCIRSSADEGTAIAELPNAVLQFKADGATAVFNLATGFIPVALMMSEADKQGFSPTWVLNTNNEFGALTTMNPPAGQLANTIAAGWAASLDTFELDPALLGPKAQECLDKYSAVGFPAPANLGELAGQLDVCSTFFALELMTADSPGALDTPTMLASLTASTEDTAALTNSLDWTGGRQPNVTYRPAAFDAATGRFAYTGDAVPMPES